MLDEMTASTSSTRARCRRLALEPEAGRNYPFMRLSGPANVLIMPAIHSAAISTQLIQALGGATVIGPILLGLDRRCRSARSAPRIRHRQHGDVGGL